MVKRIVIIGLATLVFGCATGSAVHYTDARAVGPKVVAIDAPRLPWVVEIETRLRAKGFKTLRWTSQQRVREKHNDAREIEYAEATARYILVIEGSAPMDKMNKCFGGGYNFNYIHAELIDVENNEIVLAVSGEGFSENCPPMSGTIYGDIVEAVDSFWTQ